MDKSVGSLVLESEIQRGVGPTRSGAGRKHEHIPMVGLWALVQPQRDIARQSEELLDVCSPDVIRFIDARHLVDHHLHTVCDDASMANVHTN